jgi:hypothetical protein
MYHLSTPHEKTLQSPIFFGFKEPSGETHTHTHIHTPFCFGFKEPDGETHTHTQFRYAGNCGIKLVLKDIKMSL